MYSLVPICLLCRAVHEELTAGVIAAAAAGAGEMVLLLAVQQLKVGWSRGKGGVRTTCRLREVAERSRRRKCIHVLENSQLSWLGSFGYFVGSLSVGDRK